MTAPPWLDFALTLAAVLLCVPLGLLLVECAAALLPARRAGGAPPPGLESLAVLIPAHDEAMLLPQTLEALLPQLAGGDRVVVVADNCTDATAEVARSWGVEVVERHDPEHRGKGYAIRTGLNYLATDPPELVLLLDADCTAARGAVEHLRAAVQRTGCAVQAAYRLEAPGPASPRSELSQCAITVKNLVRPLGLARLGLPCLLTGSGMAFPWPVLREASICGAHLVEDMQLSVDVLLAGRGPLFCHEAQVTSTLPSAGEAARTQRTRWEHGHLLTLVTQTPRLARAALRELRPALLIAALDLAIPPLSLLALSWLAVTALSTAVAMQGGNVLPAALLATVGAAALLTMLAAWRRHEPRPIGWRALLAIPLYVLGKAPIYLAFLVRRQQAWVRTAREPVAGAAPPPRPHLRRSPPSTLTATRAQDTEGDDFA